MIRTIKYTVSEDFKSIAPASKQWGGMQFEDNATVVAFEIPNTAGDDILWRIDFDSSSSGYDPGECLNVVDHKVSRLIPYNMTRYGGEIQVTLVGTEVDSNNETVRVVYSLPVTVYFTDVEQHEEYENKAVEHISAAEKSAVDAANIAKEAANVATQSATDSKAAAKSAVQAAESAENAAESAGAAATAANEAAKKVTGTLKAVNITYDKSKSGLESENIQDAIDELAAKTENAVSIDSWQGVQRIVNLGLAHNAFKIGDVLRCNHSTYGELSWDVVDATTERLTLCAHNIIDTLQFDEREALYYAENGLTAGVYWFSLNVRPWYPDDSNKSFLFTLNKDVPVGGHLVLDVAHNAPLNGSNVIVYKDANSTEILETAPIIEGIGLTFLGYADGSTKNLNYIIRAILGSNNYKESAIRQWLNSDGEVGNAWTPQTIFDRPSYGAVRRPGFLNGLDADFLEVISYAEYDVFQYDGTGVTGRETLTDRFMLPSRSEIYAGAVGSNSSNIEGEPFPYFSQFSDHSYPSKNADTNRIKTDLKNGKAAAWWTRTPNVYSQYIVQTILASGELSDGNDAVNGWGVVPVCHIIKKTGGNTDV